jgi:alkane 1-monooxygenase
MYDSGASLTPPGGPTEKIAMLDRTHSPYSSQAASAFSPRDVGFLTAFAILAVVAIGNSLAGAYTLLVPALCFGLIPLTDALVGVDRDNPTAAQEESRVRNAVFRVGLYAWVPAQLSIIAYSAWCFADPASSTLSKVGFVLATAVGTGSIGITIAHELGHRSARLDQWGARLLLTSVCYGHFTIEHNRGHHIRVATPLDAASARQGESLWAFVLRTIPQQYLSAWNLENARLRSTGRRALSPANRMIWFTLSVPALGALMGLVFGPMGAAFFYAHALVAVFLLESVNYLEHYGLQRREIRPGVYERVTPWHSWNASYPISNWLLFRLQRHADHHAYAGRRYQILRHIDDAPQMPASYPAMILLALVPPLWRRVMDPRVDAVRRLRDVEEPPNRRAAA